MAQLLLGVLALGAAYALIALGFVLILNATGAVNFSQGDLVMAGGFGAVALGDALHLSGLALLPALLVGMAVLGAVLAALTYMPLRRRPPEAVFISTIAFGIILQNLANRLFGAEPLAAPSLLGAGRVRFAGIDASRQSIATIGVAVLLIAALQAMFSYTQVGRRLRAMAQDREVAMAIGIRVDRMVIGTFAVAAALAGGAGLLLSNVFFVTPSAGSEYMVKAYIAVVIGGWGSLAGAVMGALLVGLFETVVAAEVSYTAASALLYAALLLILLVRPQGLFGEAAGRRA